MDDSDWVPGIFGTALDFDGSNDLVSIAAFDPPNIGTVALWFKASTSSVQQRPLGGHDAFEFNFESGGKIYNQFFAAGSEYTASTSSFNAGQWYHLAGTWDFGTSRQEIYINGVLDASSDVNADDDPGGPFTLSIGVRTGKTQYYAGLIDEVRIYSRVLSPAELAQLHSSGAPAEAPECPTLSGFAAQSQDLTADGLCEDINGNGRLDFSDIVRLFENLNTPEVQDNWMVFDFNSNGRVDMDDVIVLFERIIA